MGVLSMKCTMLPTAPCQLVEGVPQGLDGLCMALLDPDPARRPGRPEILRRLGVARSLWPSRSPLPTRRGHDAVLAGRESQLAELRDAFLTTTRGTPVTVRVGEPSGMGKTSLGRP